MSGGDIVKKEEEIEDDVRHLKLSRAASLNQDATIKVRTSIPNTPQPLLSPAKRSQSRTQSPMKSESLPQTPNDKTVSFVGGDITVKLEPGKAPKLARSSSQKIISRPPPLFNDEPDMYEEATSTFEVIQDCIYAAKWLGSTEHAMDCDCREEYDDGSNHACDEDSDCINRLTKIECTGQGSCGRNCENRRFHNKSYADVTVFKTEKKGYGLRANTELHNGDFIFEYIGEVIDEPRFRRRMRQYDDEGIKHFYFMSLNKGEFVDATKRGNLGRFCNHSCNPNSFVDKWVVGDKLCMGIFASRHIKAGEELVFNYNVDRYGADPQPCYCGEPNCTGFIGGKTQTEKATKLSDATIEALGIEDGDSWDTAVAKKPKKPRKMGEDDEEYVNKLQPKSLEEDGVNNLMATLMQCKEKWIAVKLLSRLLENDEEKVVLRVVRMHGYRTLKIVLNEFMDDANVCLQVLGVLYKFPRLSRNKIESSGIEDTIGKLKSNEDERVVEQATEILELWSELKMEYRIPRAKRDPNVPVQGAREDRNQRRARSRSRSRSRSKSPIIAPAGPRSSVPQRVPAFYAPLRPAFRVAPSLPPGWFEAKDEADKTYYYNGVHVQWERPTTAAIPAPPPKPLTNEEKLQQIINDCIKTTQNANVETPRGTTQLPVEEPKKTKEEDWRSKPIHKQKELYHGTLWKAIKPTVKKFEKKMAKEDFKRYQKDVIKVILEKDYKHKRVADPTKMDRKARRAAIDFACTFLNKVVQRGVDKQKKDKARRAAYTAKDKSRSAVGGSTTPPLPELPIEEHEDVQISDDDMSDEEVEQNVVKRKRDSETPETPAESESGTKKLKIDLDIRPPPPPPPQEAYDGFGTPMDEAPQQEPSPADTNGSDHKDFTHLPKVNGQHSPVQLATPLTNSAGSH